MLDFIEMMMASQALAEPGEVVFQSAGTSSSQTVFNWVVPTGVYEVCLLAISSHKAYATRISRGGTDLINTTWPVGTSGAGGGDGGDAVAQTSGYWGAGGAGGYSGPGGRGGRSEPDGFGGYSYYAGTAGAGGGGGGGYPAPDGRGGGVGIYGQGSNGAAGINGSVSGKPGSDTGLLRAGAGTAFNETSVAGSGGAQPGGNLRYRNAVPVSPGETLTITLDHWVRDNATGVGALVRILWYGARSYPSNAPATTPIGQITITNQDTTWTVPQGVTSISLAAQQRDGAQTAVSAVAAGVTVVRAQNENRIGDGGGNGGTTSGGGGGAGGYEGNGGDGGGSSAPVNGEYYGLSGTAGTGGGGDGGMGGSRVKDSGPVFGGSGQTYTTYSATAGGNVGIAGKNASGTYTDPVDGDSGGGPPATRGGALAWKNAVAVTPGQVLTINASGGRVRIIWGPGRSYPNNALRV